jgi:hypothetical protein
MKKLLLLSLLVAAYATAQAQTVGNEWINFNQSYYKIKITQEGVYRLSYTDLANAGIPLTGSGANPQNLQIFWRGKEQNIYVQGEGDGVFDAADYVDFYGQPNNGDLDSAMYLPNARAHNYTSLYIDTAVYYLTYGSTAGKRITATTGTNLSGTPEPYYLHQALAVYTNQYYRGGQFSFVDNRFLLSEFTEGEGWLSTRQNKGGTFNTVLKTPNYVATNAPAPKLQVLGYGVSNGAINGTNPPQYPPNNHHIKLELGNDLATSMRIIMDTTFSAYNKFQYKNDILPTDIGTTTNIQLKIIDDLNVAADGNALSYIALTYPRSFDVAGDSTRFFDFKGSSGTNAHLKFTNYAYTQPILYDFSGNLRITGLLNANEFAVMLPNNGTNKRLCLIDQTKIKSINTAIQPVVFNNLNATTTNYDYLIITSNKLITSANAYANYRQSIAGGAYKVQIVTTEQLNEQFYYGVTHHPHAIRNYLHYMALRQPTPVQHVLLLGKGYIYNELYKNASNFATRYRDNLVSTYGDPASDNLLTKGIMGSVHAPHYSIGRIAARTNTDVQNYLTKIIAYENAPDGEWKKNVFQTSGGVNIGEQIDFKNYLDTYARRLERTKVGAITSLYEKKVTAPTTENPTELLISKVNNGLLFYNYFGHGASNNLAVEPGSPDRYSNAGKYPLMYFSGCNVGNAFGVSSLGEEFIMAHPDKGAIGWIAGTNIGSPPYLNTMVSGFVDAMSDTLYGAPIGKIIKYTLDQIPPSDNFQKMHTQQLLYQGDPAMRLYSYPQPDYTIKNDGFFITPDNITALTDSFTVAIVVRNLGKATNDSVTLQLKRLLPNGTVYSIQNARIKAPYNIDTIYFSIKSKDRATRGLNRFEAFVDATSNVIETNEINNTNAWDYLIRSNSVNLLYPEAYAIAPNTTTELVFENSDLFATGKDYVVELDTTHIFNSPYKQTFNINAPTALVRQVVNLLPQDSTVYYWRAKINAPDSLGGTFEKRSFTYFASSPLGWNQTKFAQYAPNIQTNEITIDTLNKRFDFQPDVKIFSVRVDGFGTSPPTAGVDNGMRLSGALTSGGSICGAPIALTWINKTDLKPRTNANCNGPLSRAFRFDVTTAAGRAAMIQLIDTIPNGDYVGITTYGIAGFNTGAHFLKLDGLPGRLHTLGMDTMKIKYAGTGPAGSRTSLAFIGSKNNPNFTAITDTAFSLNSTKDSAAVAVAGISGRWYKGYIASERIGPASKWKQSSVALYAPPPAGTDTIRYTIVGIRQNNTDTVLFNNVTQNAINLNGVSAQNFPYLKLKVNFVDSSAYRSVPQLRRWTVLYDGLPEGTILIDPTYTFYRNPLDEGDTAKITLKYTNISPFAMDSLTVRWGVSRTGYSKISTKKIQPLAPNQTATLNLTVPTRNLTEKSIFNVFVNPNLVQPEVSLSNNFVNVNFDVKTDAIKPLLDVTFDGRHIFNNDIVSPSPNIMATLKDENRYLQNLDTSNFTVKLKRPDNSDFIPVYFGAPNSRLSLLPRTPEGKAKINFAPQNLPNGDYELWVNATDERGNRAGTEPYQITFKVINEAGISNFYPYPNPFTTQMRFVFTLTGYETPDYVKVQIFTVSGKMVREITRDEMGDMHIGNNVSEFAWDGTDQFGDRLANGVYFYKVDVRKNGEPMELRETVGDKYFKERMGKIYLMK